MGETLAVVEACAEAAEAAPAVLGCLREPVLVKLGSKPRLRAWTPAFLAAMTFWVFDPAVIMMKGVALSASEARTCSCSQTGHGLHVPVGGDHAELAALHLLERLAAVLGFLDVAEAQPGQQVADDADHCLIVVEDKDWHGQVYGYVPGAAICC